MFEKVFSLFYIQIHVEIRHLFFIRIYLTRLSRLKFAEFEYLKNKPQAEILKRILFCVLKICKYNTIILNEDMIVAVVITI